MSLIGLMGGAGAGKDTVGEILKSHYGYATVSFADTLKDCLAITMGWDRAMLEGRTPESRAWRETVDPWWAERLGIPDFTPRLAMTRFGSDVMRRHFHDHIWLLNTEKKINDLGGRVVLTDVRFKIEIEMMHRLGATLCRVERGPAPVWLPDALAALGGDDQARIRMSEQHRVHVSEWEWRDAEPHHILDNNSDKSVLLHEVDKLIGTVRLRD